MFPTKRLNLSSSSPIRRFLAFLPLRSSWGGAEMTSWRIAMQERHWSDTDSVISHNPVIKNPVQQKRRSCAQISQKCSGNNIRKVIIGMS